MDSIQLTDPSGNSITYTSIGRTLKSPAGASGPSGHTIEFAPGNLTISGSTADASIPSLTSVSVSGSPARPGDTINVHDEATDAAGALGSVAFLFRDAFQIARPITPAHISSRPLSGTIAVVVPASWPNGTYLLSSVTLSDPLDNTGTYAATGQVSITLGRPGPTSHTVDFRPATFNVSGSDSDLDPPHLTEVSLTGSPVAPGGTATLSYKVETHHPLTYIKVQVLRGRHTSGVLTPKLAFSRARFLSIFRRGAPPGSTRWRPSSCTTRWGTRSRIGGTGRPHRLPSR